MKFDYRNGKDNFEKRVSTDDYIYTMVFTGRVVQVIVLDKHAKDIKECIVYDDDLNKKQIDELLGMTQPHYFIKYIEWLKQDKEEMDSMKNIKINIVNESGKRTSTTINANIACFYHNHVSELKDLSLKEAITKLAKDEKIVSKDALEDRLLKEIYFFEPKQPMLL